jgi:hypothetical protein
MVKTTNQNRYPFIYRYNHSDIPRFFHHPTLGKTTRYDQAMCVATSSFPKTEPERGVLPKTRRFFRWRLAFDIRVIYDITNIEHDLNICM